MSNGAKTIPKSLIFHFNLKRTYNIRKTLFLWNKMCEWRPRASDCRNEIIVLVGDTRQWQRLHWARPRQATPGRARSTVEASGSSYNVTDF